MILARNMMPSLFGLGANVIDQFGRVTIEWINKQAVLIWDFDSEPFLGSATIDRRADFYPKWGNGKGIGWACRWSSEFIGQMALSAYTDMPGFVLTGRLLPDEKDRGFIPCLFFIWIFRSEKHKSCVGWSILVARDSVDPSE